MQLLSNIWKKSLGEALADAWAADNVKGRLLSFWTWEVFFLVVFCSFCGLTFLAEGDSRQCRHLLIGFYFVQMVCVFGVVMRDAYPIFMPDEKFLES